MGRKANGGLRSADPEVVAAYLRERGIGVTVGPAPATPELPAETPPDPPPPAVAVEPAADWDTHRWRRWAVSWDVPVATASEANVGGQLTRRLARKRGVKEAFAAAVPPRPPAVDWAAGWRVTVTLTRFATRSLDEDNLGRALKGCQDMTAAWLGVDDSHPLVRWRRRQRPAWPAGGPTAMGAARFAAGVRVAVVAEAPPPILLKPTGKHDATEV